MVDFNTGTGNIQDKPGIFCDNRKQGNLWKNIEIMVMSKGIRSQHEVYSNSKSWDKLRINKNNNWIINKIISWKSVRIALDELKPSNITLKIPWVHNHTSKKNLFWTLLEHAWGKFIILTGSKKGRRVKT